MPHLDDALTRIERLIREVKPQEAEDRLRALITTIGDDELTTWAPDLRRTIQAFLPKRRRDLASLLADRLGEGVVSSSEQVAPLTETDIARLRTALTDHLHDLSAGHIFQWSTYYREWLAQMFGLFVANAGAREARPALSGAMREPIATHTTEIFEKGYVHTVWRQHHDRQLALGRAVSGLQRFLDLPIELYSANSGSTDTRVAGHRRLICSAMLGGILLGFARTNLGPTTGSSLLMDRGEAWMHTLPFMTAVDLDLFLTALPASHLSSGIAQTVRPLAMALDGLDESAPAQNFWN